MWRRRHGILSAAAARRPGLAAERWTCEHYAQQGRSLRALEYGRRRSCVSFKSHTSADPADRPAVVLLHPAEQRVLRIFPFPSSLTPGW